MLKKQNRLINNSSFNFSYLQNNKQDFKKRVLFTDDFKIELYTKYIDNNVINLNVKSFLKIRIIISTKNLKLSVDRNKTKRQIKYFFIQNIINNTEKNIKNTQKQQFILITLIKKQQKDIVYKNIERQLKIML